MNARHSTVGVKVMLIALNADATAHAVSLNAPTRENVCGFHRLIGGSVEFGETHKDAIQREIREELDARIKDLRFLAAVESIFEVDGNPSHEIVFLYSGSLDPMPSETGALLIESDGSVLPVIWRSFEDEVEPLPLYPTSAAPWLAVIRHAGNGDTQPD